MNLENLKQNLTEALEKQKENLGITDDLITYINRTEVEPANGHNTDFILSLGLLEDIYRLVDRLIENNYRHEDLNRRFSTIILNDKAISANTQSVGRK